MVKQIARSIRRLERQVIPNFRNHAVYKVLWFVVIGLPLLLLSSIEYSIGWVIRLLQPKGEVYLNKLHNILNGWTNLAFSDPKVEALATKRASICAQCPAATFSSTAYAVVVDNKTSIVRGMSCSDCGCPLSAKVRAVDDSCPRQKW